MLNGNYLSISFEKVAISLPFLTLKNFELLQNVGILRVLKNRELQIREIQGRELQGLPVYVTIRIGTTSLNMGRKLEVQKKIWYYLEKIVW